MRLFVTVLLSFGLITQTVFAQAVITEIMYDLPGSDGGREWIEIQNLGAEVIDLSKWRLYEQDTNHTLRVISGNALLPPGAYAVIADNAEKFLADWPRFSETIFDSSFSLKNDGEALMLRDDDLHEVNSVFYRSAWGGRGNGRSLQLESGEWKEGEPTPGMVNKESLPPVAEKKTLFEEKTVSEEKVFSPQSAVSETHTGEDVDEPEINADAVQVAAVYDTEQNEEHDMFWWLLALFSVVGAGVVAAVIFRREKSQNEIEILE